MSTRGELPSFFAILDELLKLGFIRVTLDENDELHFAVSKAGRADLDRFLRRREGKQ